MNLASAYPNSALSAGALAVIALVAVGTLAFWLIMVFVAAREPRARQARDVISVVPDEMSPGRAAEDNHSEADSGRVAQHQEAAA